MFHLTREFIVFLELVSSVSRDFTGFRYDSTAIYFVKHEQCVCANSLSKFFAFVVLTLDFALA